MVTPARLPTVTDLPVRRWNSVDLPVLGLPTSAILTGAIWVEIGLRTIPRRGQIVTFIYCCQVTIRTMKSINFFLLIIGLLGLSQVSLGQTPWTAELELLHNHLDSNDLELYGFRTYQLKVQCPDSNFKVIGIYSNDSSPLNITCTESFWQHPFGSAFNWNN